MPYRPSGRRPRQAMFNTPAIRTGGFGALQVEAVTNRPLSIARRHLAASQLRIRDIEPDELSSSEWVSFLVMEEQERDRWMSGFLSRRSRRDSNESSSSVELDPDTTTIKAAAARLETEQAAMQEPVTASASIISTPPTASGFILRGRTPPASLWARRYEELENSGPSTARISAISRPLHTRRAVTESLLEAPPTYESTMRALTPPPAYRPRREI